MYYSSGNYEAFARPRKTEGVEKRSAYLIGAGLASLAAAAFLIRDGHMRGDRIHILEAQDIAGGGLDGINDDGRGFVIRGSREMETHFECLWDLLRSVPSLEVDGASVFDEFYWLNKDDPNDSPERAIHNQGKSAKTIKKLTLSETAAGEMIKLFFTPEENLADLRINDVFSGSFFASNFWLHWRTTFAMEPWHSAMEMRRYIARFIHHIASMPDASGLKFTRYNQYESLILPLLTHLRSKGVTFDYGVTVTNVEFDIFSNKKVAHTIVYLKDRQEGIIDLAENDLVFITNGCTTENASFGDHRTPAMLLNETGESWRLWRNIAVQDRAFGNPDKFCGNVLDSCSQSATLTTLDDRILPYIEKICKRDPLSGKIVTGGPVSIKDSGWMMSFTIDRQPHFKAQPKNQVVVWLYALNCDASGDFITKPIRDCSGFEIAQEWLYHLGVPMNQIPGMAARSANCIPCMMPFVKSCLMPRAIGDRPRVVPRGCVNAAFIGNHAETSRDAASTTEYSVRTAMEAVYTLLGVERGVPEVFGSAYDARSLMDAAANLLDGKKIPEAQEQLLPGAVAMEHKAARRVHGTHVLQMMTEYGLV